LFNGFEEGYVSDNREWLVEHRYRAVLEVLDGSPVAEVASRYGVSRQSVYAWKRRYQASGLDGLREVSRRPHTSPTRLDSELEALICELRRSHPRWGARRIAFELGRRTELERGPSRATVHRVLTRNGLVNVQDQQHKRKYKRWQRETPMALWQMDLVGGVFLADGRECKLLTGLDDHARYVVICAVLVQPTGRAVCEAFLAAIARYGVPSEVLTDNGKQFTGRFTKPRPAEVMFERVCRENGITQRLTKVRSPTTTGKIERFHRSLREELLDQVAPFESMAAAQAAIDSWVQAFNHSRPHQALDMATPASVFRPTRAVLTAPAPSDTATAIRTPEPLQNNGFGDGAGSVSYVQRVPPAGVFAVVPGGQQVFLGPVWAGRDVTIWADERSVHILADGHHVKTVPSRLTPKQLQQMLMRGGRAGGPQPAAPALPQVNGRFVLPSSRAVEVDRIVQRDGWINVANRNFSVSGDLVGQKVTLRLDGHLMHATADGRIVGSWSCPLATDQLTSLRHARPAAELPKHAPSGPAQVLRRIPVDGVTMVARQRLRVGRTHAGKVVTVVIEDTCFRVLDGDQELAIHPRHGYKTTRLTAYNRHAETGAKSRKS
jgi:transposase InsO family protein